MEVIRAILGILIGVFVLTVFLNLLEPLLILFLIFIAIVFARSYFLNRKMQSRPRYSEGPRQQQSRQRKTSSTQSTGRRATSSDVFEAEYTEEELD